MHGKIPQSISEFINRASNSSITIQATLNKNDKLDEIPKGIDRIKINQPWILNNSQLSLNSQLKNCPFLGKEAWVWVDGTFQVCPNPDARFGMRTKFPFGDFGNFIAQEPWEIWNGKKYRDFCKNYKEHLICKNCKMRC